MAGIHVSVPHTLGREGALERVRKFLDDMRVTHAQEVSDVRGEWNDNRLDFGFAARGFGVRGTLLVEDAVVNVTGPLPLAAMFFRGKIERTIREELEKLLG